MIYVNNKSGFLICFYRVEPARRRCCCLVKKCSAKTRKMTSHRRNFPRYPPPCEHSRHNSPAIGQPIFYVSYVPMKTRNLLKVPFNPFIKAPVKQHIRAAVRQTTHPQASPSGKTFGPPPKTARMKYEKGKTLKFCPS